MLDILFKMFDSQKLHDEKYRIARESGMSGWGGNSRIEKIPKTIQERFLSFPDLMRSGDLLEIGCGAGNVSIELTKLGYRVLGVDFSVSAIEWAQENAKNLSLEIDFRVANVTKLSSCEDAFFDIVYDGNCIHCLIGEERKKTYSEIKRVMKKGGIFFLSSLCVTNAEAQFPKDFDCETAILYEGKFPYRYIPTPSALEKELVGHGFVVRQKFIRSGQPFGHVHFHTSVI